eukprot:1158163-Pelagomonas_calceolata.AAC.15
MGDILCDEPTFSNARYKAKYEELEPLSVKGKKMPRVPNAQRLCAFVMFEMTQCMLQVLSLAGCACAR